MKKIISKIQIHYYFDDTSHTMDAFVRNRTEKDFLDALNELLYLLEIDDSKIESEAYEKGGLIETLNLVSQNESIDLLAILGSSLAGLKILSPSINKLISHYFTSERMIEKEKLKGLKLDNEKKELENIEKILENPKIKRYASNFFKKADEYDKIVSIGFKDVDTNKENIVEKNEFDSFILKDDTDIEIDQKANIKIISPVLGHSRHMWKGYYQDQSISFSMADMDFKKSVISKKYKFSNGTYIECELKITSKYDSSGELVSRPTYSVQKVFKILDGSGIEITTEKGKQKKIDDGRGTLDLYPE